MRMTRQRISLLRSGGDRSLARMARPSCSDAAILPTAAATKRCCHTAGRAAAAAAAEESNDCGENNTFGKSSEEEEKEGQSRLYCKGFPHGR